MSQIGFSHPTGTIEAPCVVATVCRGIDAKFRPLEFFGPICVWCICEHVPLWMPPKPHLVYQVGKSLHTSHRMFYCGGQLVAASEGVPYLDDKGIRFTETSLPSDLQRRSAQPVPIHLLPRKLAQRLIDGAQACHYSAQTKIRVYSRQGGQPCSHLSASEHADHRLSQHSSQEAEVEGIFGRLIAQRIASVLTGVSLVIQRRPLR